MFSTESLFVVRLNSPALFHPPPWWWLLDFWSPSLSFFDSLHLVHSFTDTQHVKKKYTFLQRGLVRTALSGRIIPHISIATLPFAIPEWLPLSGQPSPPPFPQLALQLFPSLQLHHWWFLSKHSVLYCLSWTTCFLQRLFLQFVKTFLNFNPVLSCACTVLSANLTSTFLLLSSKSLMTKLITLSSRRVSLKLYLTYPFILNRTVFWKWMVF